MRQDLVCCPEDLRGLTDTLRCFCCGPIQGAPLWQHNLPKIQGLTWISPRRLDYKFFDYDQQTSWETIGIRSANMILFWIPAPIEDISGRCYAQTTRIEFGEVLGRYDKPCVFGCYPDFPGRKYLEYKIKEYTGQVLHDNLDDCLTEIREKMSARITPRIFFTSDTHFGSSRTLELSRRPFLDVKEMDWTMISRWNSVVGPSDVVYHLGDFGETWPIDYLSGNIKMVRGNYERSGKSEIPEGIEILGDSYNLDGKYFLSHEPLIGKEHSGIDHLFGHIHGRQQVKSWGGLDVGVDCNNFTPVSEDKARFYLEAIRKGYYDQEVWS